MLSTFLEKLQLTSAVVWRRQKERCSPTRPGRREGRGIDFSMPWVSIKVVSVTSSSLLLVNTPTFNRRTTLIDNLDKKGPLIIGQGSTLVHNGEKITTFFLFKTRFCSYFNNVKYLVYLMCKISLDSLKAFLIALNNF
jgi:hypothetical protein